MIIVPQRQSYISYIDDPKLDLAIRKYMHYEEIPIIQHSTGNRIQYSASSHHELAIINVVC